MKTQRSSTLLKTSALLTLAWKLPARLLLLGAAVAFLENPMRLAAATNSAALPSIFVAPLHGEKQIGFWQPAVGDGLAEMLITELTKLGKFRVLESTTLEEIKTEIKMGSDGWIMPDEKVEKGQWQGSDYMFVGKITRFASKTKKFGGSGWGLIRLPNLVQGFDVSTDEAEVAIDWRIVDTASREIIKSGRSNGKEKGTSWGFNGGTGSGFFREQQFLDSALGKATVKAVDEIAASLSQLKLGPGKNAVAHATTLADAAAKEKAAQVTLRSASGTVEAVTAQFLVVSLGEKHGLKAGDKLELCEVNEVRNKKGEVVMRDEKWVGEVTVQSVQADKSKVRFEGKVKPEEGWMVRIPAAAETATASIKQ